MKNGKFLMALACLGLLITGCNKTTESKSESAAPATTSAQTSKSTTTSKPAASSPSKSSSSSKPVEQETGNEGEEEYIAWPFGYNDKWEKGKEYKWTFDVKAAHQEVTFAFGAQLSNSSHSSRTLYCDHNGASSSDPFESNAENDGTPRLSLKVNGVDIFLTRETYGNAGLNADSLSYFRVAKFGIPKAGKYEVSLTTHAETGYRLYGGGDARLYYPKTEPATASGYNVSFAATNCKVYIYESQDTAGEGTEYTAPVQTRDADGELCKYGVPSTANGKDEVKPQVNFKVVATSGYKVNGDCIKISGVEGYEWNALKDQGAGIFRITKIKADIAVTITADVDEGGEETPDAWKINFVLEHCTVKVYKGKKNEAGDNLDTDAIIYSRNGDTGEYGKGDNGQVNFEVVPEANYEFVETATENGDATPANVTFITGTFNKLKRVDKENDPYLYRVTKVQSELTITLVCTAKAA